MTAGGESVFERIYIFSPSIEIEIDDAWKPVKSVVGYQNIKWNRGIQRNVFQTGNSI